MFSRPQTGTDSNHKAGVFRKTVFAACFILAVFFIYLLIDYRHTSSQVMSGELFAPDAGYPTLNGRNSSFLNFIFDYFGGVTYVFPVIFMWVVWMVVMHRIALKQIDFFAVGLRVLGFNLLVLGLTALFSGLFAAGDSGAGGILGDFLYITFYRYLPPFIASLLPILISVTGVLLLTAKTPWWYCDTLGAFLVGLTPWGKKEAAEEAKKETPAVPVRAPTPESVATLARQSGEVIMPGTVRPASDGSQNGSAKAADTSAKPAEEGKAPQSIFSRLKGIIAKERQSEPLSERTAAFKHDIEPTFGADAAAPAPAQDGGLPAGSADLNARGAELHQPDGRDGMFGPGAGRAPAGTQEPYRPLFDHGAAQRDHAYGAEESGYAQGYGRDPSPYGAEPPRASMFGSLDDKESASSGQPSTIIRDARQPQAPVFPGDNRQSTIITKFINSDGLPPQPAAPQGPSTNISYGPSPNGGYRPSSLADFPPPPAERSTIITKHEGIKDTVSLPGQESGGVSTVITKGSAPGGPINLTPGAVIKDPVSVNFPLSGSSPAGAPSSLAQPTPAATLAESPRYDGQEQEEDGIINFEPAADLMPGAVEVSSLTSAFVPSAGTQGGLTPDSAPLISEKDPDYSSLQATRGIVGSSEAAPQQSAVQVSVPQQSAPQAPVSQAPAALPERTQSASVVYDPTDSPFIPPLANPPGHSSLPVARGSSMVPAGGTYQSAADDGDGVIEVMPEFMREQHQATPTQFPTMDYEDVSLTAPKDPYGPWRPSVERLARSRDAGPDMTDEEIRAMSALLNNCLSDYKIKAHVASYAVGPVITQYGIALDPGVRGNTIANMENDLARMLQVKHVRFLDGIPGTTYVGLEVPNRHRKLITLGDVLVREEYARTKAALPLCLGVNATGNTVITDLAKAPHLLIAGTTGSGKSAGINSMLLSLLLKLSPSQLRLIMVDPKQLEFALYHDIPHLIAPIITEPDEMVAALRWAVGEMERRYSALAAMGVRQLSEYNAKLKECNDRGQKVYDPRWTPEMGGYQPELRTLPYLVIVIDEFADLMAVKGSGKKSADSPENLIGRLAAKARACGIHLILATQTPRAEIVTGKIKANMPSRIAYTVQSRLESNIILDDRGAESLLGNGDMIAKLQDIDVGQAFRAHGPFASNEDVNAVCDDWRSCGAPEYIEGVTKVESDEPEDVSRGGHAAGGASGDQLYQDIASFAMDYAQKKGKDISISQIQISFSIGYTKAKRMMMRLIEDGIVKE